MLILENGDTFGIISGGCLESDVLERAKKILQTDEPEVFTYDTSKGENSVFSLNMGCRGVIRILLEPIGKENDFFNFVSECLNARQTCKVATLIKPQNTNLKIGSRLFQNETRFFSNDFSADESAETQNLFEKTAGVVNLSFGEVFIETIKPPLSLLIFGAGADAAPLVEIAKNIGWRVAVIDHRAAYASKERFPNADEILVVRPENLAKNLTVDENSAAVVMTHNYESDKQIHKFFLNSKIKYIGALGPKKRTEKLLKEIGANFSENLYAPVGLDIGADTPEAIALSIAAEIQSVLRRREGGFLRNRHGSVYGRDE